jgi:general secretion pathway protein G
MNRRQKAGFTLVELMLVVVIIGVLAGIVLPRLAGSREEANIAAAKAQMRVFDTSLYTYQLQVGSFPTTEQGLRALVEAPGEEGWKGPYLSQKVLPRDPLGQSLRISEGRAEGIRLRSVFWDRIKRGDRG